ncbi:hypothetical protein HZS_596 [Henneguya salminicola]|nr:hypothetical protein HZS_596 [Henneguya salminicola]
MIFGYTFSESTLRVLMHLKCLISYYEYLSLRIFPTFNSSDKSNTQFSISPEFDNSYFFNSYLGHPIDDIHNLDIVTISPPHLNDLLSYTGVNSDPFVHSPKILSSKYVLVEKTRNNHRTSTRKTNLSSIGQEKSCKSKNSPYSCNYEGCNKKYTRKYDLTRHMEKHTNDNKYICSCKEKFSDMAQFQIHLQQHVEQLQNINQLNLEKVERCNPSGDDI